MAVETRPDHKPAAPGSGRRMLVGAHVVLMTLLALAVVGVFQYLGVKIPKRWDLTSSAVNSLSEGSEKLIRGLDSNVRLTSLYFKTDIEAEDQQRYRQAVENLLSLYESLNRSKVVADWINPLSDHEKMKALFRRLREKKNYASELETYKSHIDRFHELNARIASLLESESSSVRQLTAGVVGESRAARVLSPIETLISQLTNELDLTVKQAEAFSVPDDPQYSAAVGEIKRLYRTLTDRFKKLTDYANGEAARGGELSPATVEYLRGVGGRNASLVSTLEEELKTLDALEPLKLDNILRELRPNANLILVETDAEAMIVDFDKVFPPLDPNAAGRVGFSRRAFKGEEQLTSAILRITHKDQTAVVFVRYGGSPLFFGGFPGQGAAPYAQMRKQLEDANFVVEEWDLKSTTDMPKIDPPPTRTIFVVLRPTPPQRNPMLGQQPPDPPFAEHHRQALMQAMGDNPRALFIAGWEPPSGMSPIPMPTTYEFNEYLKTTWGVSADTSALLVEFVSFAPGKYMPARRDFFNLTGAATGSHDIVRSPQSRLIALPFCAPLTIAEKPPEGVTLEKLVWQPKKDGVWGVKNLQKYQEQQTEQDYLSRVEGDLEGPFDLAVAGTKGESKIVVVSSRSFAEDNFAFAAQLALTSEGITMRNPNPGNATLMVNALHWLNDNTRFLNIGQPIEAAVLAVDPKAVARVKVVTIVLWPALALLAGGVAWWIRRR